MLPAGCRVLCAVSGGADSMCLLHKLHSAGVSVTAAHFNHRIRGEEADRDEAFVKAWCAEHDIPCVCGSADVPQYAREKGIGTEEAARELRYEFLYTAAKDNNCTCIATAHNANDNAETVLLNLIRGSGARGLCGIPPVREGDVKIVRPILGMSRAEIEEYDRVNGVSYVTDSTNDSDDYTRNLVRHKLLPVMAEINPRLCETVLRTSESLREDEEYLSGAAEKFIAEHYRNKSIDIARLKELPKPIALRVFRSLCGRALTRQQAESIFALLNGTELAFCDVPGLRVMRDTGRLYFGAEIKTLGEYAVPVNGSVFVPEAGLTVTTEIIRSCTDVYKFDFNYDRICGNISLTSRKSGDKIRLSYRSCTKSLKELFLEKGIPQHKRDSVPVLRDEQGVMAVPGFGMDARFSAKPGDTILRIKFTTTGEN